MKNRGWYSRGYLPHLDVIGEIQAVTFRLADALPVQVMARLKREAAGSAGLQTGSYPHQKSRSEDERSRQLKMLIIRYETRDTEAVCSAILFVHRLFRKRCYSLIRSVIG